MSDLDLAQSPTTPGEVLSRTERSRIAREALIGKSIAGRYVLRSLLGHGGMGAVYEAEHVGIGKRVAIKFVDSEFVTDEQVVTRFAREARAMSAIESPHIVTIFDAGTDDGRPYLVMELLRGEDLGQRLRRTTRVPLAESLHIIAMVLKGLGKAHAAGIVHRDLKPDNVFLVKDANEVFAKIVDFGVSKIERPRNRTSPLALTGRGTVLGTPFYMSPEQAQAVADLDGRADIFSVGTILFECLAGRPPHTGETYEQIILSICMRDSPDLRTIDPSIPAPVAGFVAKALARDRTHRFATADDMLAALHELSPVEKKAVPADPPGNKTLVASAGLPPSNVTAATPTSVRPFKGASTQIAGSVATGPATPVQLPAVAVPPPVTSPLAKSDSAITPAGVPRPRSMSAIVATALVATLLGILATFAIISTLGKKDDPPKPIVAIPSAIPATPSSTLAAPAVSSPAPVVSASTSASAEPVKHVSAPAVTASHPAIVTSPKPPTSKALDINRDLP